MAKTKILVVDDDTTLRRRVRELLCAESDLEVVGEAASGLGAIDKAKELMPHLVLMDIRLPEMNGLEATRCLKSIAPELVVIILTIFEDEEYRQAALAAGAIAFVVKRNMMEELVPAIRRALKKQGT